MTQTIKYGELANRLFYLISLTLPLSYNFKIVSLSIHLKVSL